MLLRVRDLTHAFLRSYSYRKNGVWPVTERCLFMVWRKPSSVGLQCVAMSELVWHHTIVMTFALL